MPGIYPFDAWSTSGCRAHDRRCAGETPSTQVFELMIRYSRWAIRSGFSALLGAMALALTAGARPAPALESATVVTPQTTAALVSDTDHVAPGVRFYLALRLSLAPGWHIYWKNPGQSGLPPQLQLDLPPGTQSGAIAWPAPEHVREGSLIVYAYSGRVLLSLPVASATGSRDLAVRAEAHWLVCKDVCTRSGPGFN